MNRLPQYVVATSWFERGIFLSLMLAALGLIVLTLADALQFAGDREKIVSALTRPTESLVASSTNNASTNLTSFQQRSSTERSRLNSLAVPKS